MKSAPPPPVDPYAAFEPLSLGEQMLCAAARAGTKVGMTPKDPAELKMHVRAGLVRFLLVADDPSLGLHERGFRIENLVVNGKLDLASCQVRRNLSLLNCDLDVVDLVDATLPVLTIARGNVQRIDGDRCRVAGSLLLRGVTVREGVRLLDAHIGSDLDCTEATLSAQDAGSAVMDARTALGLQDATVAGNVFLIGATFTGDVVAANLAVGKLLATDGCRVVSGQLAAQSAKLGNDLILSGSTFGPSPVSSVAVALAGATVAGSMLLTEHFTAFGQVDVSDMRVDGNVTLRGARFVQRGGFGLNAQRLRVDGTFDLDWTTRFAASLDAAAAADVALAQATPPAADAPALDLTAATVGSLSDEGAAWPRGNRLLGFRYADIVGATPTAAAWWIAWLERQSPADLAQFKPQAWDRAILALNQAGCRRDAEDVAIAKEAAAHRHDPWARRWAWGLWGIFVGYGYRPLRLLWLLPVVYVVSGFIYMRAAAEGVVAPTDDKVVAAAEFQHCHPEHNGNWTRCALAPAYPDFYPWAYALEVMLPAVKLRQADQWAPVPWRRPVTPSPQPASAASAAAAEGASPELPPVSTFGVFALAWSWGESTLGLGAPLLLGLALSGLIRRKLRD